MSRENHLLQNEALFRGKQVNPSTEASTAKNIDRRSECLNFQHLPYSFKFLEVTSTCPTFCDH
eukprot:5692048-Amphidinium_carterae.1